MSCYHIPKSRSHLGLKPSHAICEKCGVEIVKVKPRKSYFRTFLIAMLLICAAEGVKVSVYSGSWILGIVIVTVFVLLILLLEITHKNYKIWQKADSIEANFAGTTDSERCRHKPDDPFVSILSDKQTSSDQPRRCMKCGAIIQMKKPYRLFAKIAAILINIVSFIMYFFCLIFFVYDAKTTGGMIKFSVISYIIFAVLLLLRVFGLGDLCKWERVGC